MTLESPLGHTALIVVTFSAKKQDFGEGWHDLIANVVPFGSRPKATMAPSGPRTPGWSRRRSRRPERAGLANWNASIMGAKCDPLPYAAVVEER